MSETNNTNQQAQDLDKDVSTVVKMVDSVAIKAAEAWFDANVPVTNFPVLHEIRDALITVIANAMAEQVSIALQQIGTFVVIDTQVTKEKHGVSQALASLMVAEKSGDQNAIQNAINTYCAANNALIDSDGSARPQ